ncbi:MAG: 6-hydroxymethylpterin diphosphokinase MptE-like protein [Gammaproteobacteria bacterium]|nr:6-hydroxymethylpterin diphosphokinase MptE-like protein [Gammaproteobacteria bacterium]
MTEIDKTQQMDSGNTVCNAFGECYLFAINRNLFENTCANTVFQTQYGESLFQKDTFYVIPGTDSGLLFQYVKKHGIPAGSRYLFVELPHVLVLLGDLGSQEPELQITSDTHWLAQAKAMGAENYALLGQLTLMRSRGVLHGHYPDYPHFWSRLKGEFDAFSWQYALVQNAHYFTMRQIENLTENQVPALCLKDSFRGKTAVLLAGGPSLDELLPWVRQHRKNLLVIAVSRVSRALIQAGIQPDISVSIDPQPINLEVSRDMLEFQDGTLLVNNTHLTPYLLSSWGGEKVFIGQRYPWSTPQEPENLPPIEGPTVTESAFSFVVETGVTQIILGGADFCFSQSGYTHASGTAEHALGPRPMAGNLQVTTNSGVSANTSATLLKAAQYIDTQSQNAMARGCRTVNPAAGAMRLLHVDYAALNTIQITPMEIPARKIIADCVPPSDARVRISYYKEILSEVDHVLTELSIIKGLANKALIYNHKLIAKKEKGSEIHNKAKIKHVEKQLDGKYISTSTFIKHFGVRRFLLLLRPTHRNTQDIEYKKNQHYFQAFIETSDEILDMLRLTRTRILSRVEEESPKPDVRHLIEQWRRDQQPGRAINWARYHAAYVSHLPIAEQQLLHDYQESIADVVAEIAQDHSALIERGASLGGAPDRAYEYFQCQNQQGLQRLLAGLEKNHKPDQAVLLIPLIRGYIAELEGDDTSAITAYESIASGPAYLNALKRRLMLYSNAGKNDAAIDALKTMSGLNSSFTPLYADMLLLTGNIDEAMNVYTDYLLDHPNDLDTVLKAGKLFWQCDMPQGADWAVRYILEKDPHNQNAQRFLIKIEKNTPESFADNV